MNPQAKKILIVEDSPTTSEMFGAFLSGAGYGVRQVDTGRKALAATESPDFDLMLLDLALPDMDGIEILQELEARRLNLPSIVITGNGSVRRAVEAMRLGAMDFIMKPCSLEKLGQSVESALARRALGRPALEGGGEKAPASTSRGPSGFLGQSPAMQNVFTLIERAAQSQASIFITGESGTGKELCAQAIHDSSSRRNGPFVALNCAAIPRELMESEVFGHRRGAFTGAQTDYQGAASRADGGTFFLDEICEMRLDLQAKLLRFIQAGSFKRLGDTTERFVDLRFICATNRNPLEEVRAGRFREDLYYRLFVVPIHMPPLRERRSDIILLAERFLNDYGAVEKKRFRGFDPEARRAIASYPWPGNVRQLENTIRQIVVLNDGETVSQDMLPLSLRAAPRSERSILPETAGEAGEGPGAPLDSLLIRPLDELDIMAIDAALAKFDGNVSRAARALDISTSTIYRKKQAWEKRQR